MEYLKELAISLTSNLVWAGFIFGYIYIKNKKQRLFAQKALVSYLLFLSRQRINLQNFIGPYVFLLEKKLDHSEILTRVLRNIHYTCGEILLHTQSILALVQDQIPSTQLISLYQKTLEFQNHTSGSMVQMDLIVGNPHELIHAEEKLREELEKYNNFLVQYPEEVLQIFRILPEKLKAELPSQYQETLTKKLEMGGNF